MQPKRPKRKHSAPKRARTPWGLIIGVGIGGVVVVLAIVLGSAALKGSNNADIIIPTAIAERTAPQKGFVLGDDSAPVTLVEYFRFDCRYCADFVRDTAPSIEKDYIDAKSVRFEAVPLAVEGKILTASEAAECAADQNRYWDYHDVLFANYDQISVDAFDTSRLKEYAVKLGLDTEAFNSCLNSGKYKQAVIDKTKEVVQAGFQSTPTFFIGLTKDMKTAGPGYTGQKAIVGAQPIEVFKTAIDELLKKAQ